MGSCLNRDLWDLWDCGHCLNARRIWSSTPQIADYTDVADSGNVR